MSKAIADILRTKAQHDFNAAAILADADQKDVGDEIFGLLIQQAVEKAAKCLLASKNIKYPFTHEIDRLFQDLTAKGLPVPGRFSDLEMLTPFATQARYETAISRGLFDRPRFLNLVREFLAWIDVARRKASR